MKKFFLFAAAVATALTVNAQQITFAEGDAAGAGATFGSNGFILTITADDDSKTAVDANNCYFGDAETQVKYTARLKTGGKSAAKNAMKLTIPAAGKLYVFARTGSNSATDRNVAFAQFGAEILNHTLLESEAIQVKGLDSADPDKETNVYPVLSCDVQAGDVEITYPVGSVNFYAFEFVSSQGIDNTNAAVKVEKFYRDGQLIIRKNGVEYNALGVKL